MRARLWLVGSAGFAACVGASWLAAHQSPNRPTDADVTLTVLVGVTLIGCGLAAWDARADSRLGPATTLTGFAWFAGQLSEARGPLLYTIGTAVEYLWAAGIIYLLLSFPSGRLRGATSRWLMGGACALIAMQLLAMVFGDRAGLRCPGCPRNLARLIPDNVAATGWLNLERLVSCPLALLMIIVLSNRVRVASPGERRTLAPVIGAGSLWLVVVIWTNALDLLGDPLGATPAHVLYATTAAVPIAIAYVLLRQRLARGMVAGLVVELGRPERSTGLREALARALGDPSLQLAYWFAGERCYVDGDGTPVRLPEPDEPRRSTFVTRDGQPIAVLVHDPALQDEAELVESVCAAASLALENERLAAELKARLVELHASRARLVQATDAERRRIERDLHDGTQQRLVSIAMSLGLLESRLPQDDVAARPLVRESRDALALALAELRELTHGINPPLLVEQGLPAALDELARRAGLPTRLRVTLARRPPAQVESAAYFVASEGLANATKHSHSREVTITVSEAGSTLVLELCDDGIGGAIAAGGTGLRGLTDRVEALGGAFTVTSPPGRGTRLRAEFPCG